MLQHPGKVPSHGTDTRKSGCKCVSLDCKCLAPVVLSKLTQTTETENKQVKGAAHQQTPSQSIQFVQTSIWGNSSPPGALLQISQTVLDYSMQDSFVLSERKQKHCQLRKTAPQSWELKVFIVHFPKTSSIWRLSLSKGPKRIRHF